jgi:acetyl-CoA C-acetyltransferase
MAVQEAEQDSHIKFLSKKADTLCLVNMFSISQDDPPALLSARLDIHPKHREYTWIGATAPQWFVNHAAEKIISGNARLVLICGGEALHSKKIDARLKGVEYQQWSFSKKEPWMVGDLREPFTKPELQYRLILPIHVYPLFENALRHHEKLSIEDHRKELGDSYSIFSSIAATNKYAWFTTPKSSEEIITPNDTNPMISFPYTKLMCSIMQVDQAAALFLTDEHTARQLGVPKKKWIYLLGYGDASNIWHVSKRINYYSSPAVKVAVEKALEQAEISLGEIDLFDFYSCFPSASRIARSTLSLPKDDPRPLTVTGGMAYFGGPGNNYALHAICSMVERLRSNPDYIGLVQALSWFINKHSVGIYSAHGSDAPKPQIPHELYQMELDKLSGPELIENASGSAVVETYTLFHDRSGEPVDAVIIGRLDDGTRFLAKLEPDKDVLKAMTKNEHIGRQGKVYIKEELNVFRF